MGERKPALLYLRHHVNITTELEGGLNNMNQYEEMAKIFNDALASNEEKDRIISEKDKIIAKLLAENALLKENMSAADQ